MYISLNTPRWSDWGRWRVWPCHRRLALGNVGFIFPLSRSLRSHSKEKAFAELRKTKSQGVVFVLRRLTAGRGKALHVVPSRLHHSRTHSRAELLRTTLSAFMAPCCQTTGSQRLGHFLISNECKMYKMIHNNVHRRMLTV